MTTQRLHVKTVGLGRENEEGDDSHVTVGILQQVIQSGQRFYEHVRTLVGKLVSIEIHRTFMLKQSNKKVKIWRPTCRL